MGGSRNQSEGGEEYVDPFMWEYLSLEVEGKQDDEAPLITINAVDGSIIFGN